MNNDTTLPFSFPAVCEKKSSAAFNRRIFNEKMKS